MIELFAFIWAVLHHLGGLLRNTLMKHLECHFYILFASLCGVLFRLLLVGFLVGKMYCLQGRGKLLLDLRVRLRDPDAIVNFLVGFQKVFCGWQGLIVDLSLLALTPRLMTLFILTLHLVGGLNFATFNLVAHQKVEISSRRKTVMNYCTKMNGLSYCSNEIYPLK